MIDERPVPWYAVHKDGLIAGFFGSFSFLSNFYPLQNGVVFEELCYPSVEAAYQAAKWPWPGRFLYDGNKTASREIFTTISAAKAKRLGRLAPNFDGRKWNKKKYDIMFALVLQKFRNNPIQREMLFMTSGCTLEERNSWGDTDWGTDEQGKGENNLGKILMNIRDRLKIGPEDQF